MAVPLLRRFIFRLRSSWRMRLLCFCALLPLLIPVILHTVLKLARLDAMWICDGYACTLDNYNDVPRDPCQVLRASSIPYCVYKPDCTNDDIRIVDDGVQWTVGGSAASVFTFEFPKPRSLSGVTMTGSAAIYISKSRKGPWVLLTNVSSRVKSTVFFRPKSAKFVQFRSSQAQQVTVAEFLQDCYGCSWLPDSAFSTTCAVSDVTKKVTCQHSASSPMTLTGILPPSTLTIGPTTYNIEHAVVTFPRHEGNWSFMIVQPDLLEDDVEQILYLNGYLGKVPPKETTAMNIEYSFSLGPNDVVNADAAVTVNTKIGETCTDGMLTDMDAAFTVHFAKATMRAKTHTAMARRLKTQFEIGSDWTRDRVIKEKETVEKEFNWPGARTLGIGKPILQWVGTPKEVWVERNEGTMKTRIDKTTPQMLGAVACSMQHYKALHELVDRNLSAAFITEDDGSIVANFVPKFSKVMSEAPSDFDIIFIGGCLAKHASPMGGTKVTESLWSIRQHRCASAYVVSRKAALSLLNSEWPQYDAWMNIDPSFEYHMDTLIPHIYWAEPPLMFEATKALFSTGSESVKSIRLSK
eukprot:TRINITY_DN593_c1_g2_i1.p1 TRINITY_DN593_c1_g2~~TRINITY_DN593_c1_g2_i1.p1  ORF type:complete len:580 (+),score=67.03 TRINITY_DN593_c1_g2_i1:45-1784(+)